MPSPHPHTPPPPHYPPMPAFPGRPPMSPPFGVRPGESGLNPRSMGENHPSPYNHFPQKGIVDNIPHHLQHQQQFPHDPMDTKPMFPTNRGMDASPYGSHRFLQDHHLSSYSPYSSHHPFPHPGNYGPPPVAFPNLPPSLTPGSVPLSTFGNSAFPPASIPSTNPQSGGSSAAGGNSGGSGSIGGSGSTGCGGSFPPTTQNSPPLEAFVQLLLAMNSDDQLKVRYKNTKRILLCS